MNAEKPEFIDLWLDDMRPAPAGWHLVKTVNQAKSLLSTGLVRRASLDHDLGACEECMKMMAPESMSAEEWLAKTNFKAMPNCEHFGTGYQLVCWMEEFNVWPSEKPTVHSANPVGRSKMQVPINKHYDRQN